MPIRFAILMAATLLSACAGVPRSGPLTADVLEEAKGGAEGPLTFALIATDGAVVQRLRTSQPRADLSALASGPAVYGRRLRTGDQVRVMLFEATGGGLFGAGPDAGAGVRELPVQTVSSAGTLRIPYGGDVRVRGLSPEAAARRIEAALRGQAIEPQAVVSLIEQPSASVTVLGDAVASGGRIPLAGTGERVLDMVAAAGGLTKPIHESALRLTRSDQSSRVGFGHLLENPAQNVPVHPRDVISVEHAPRHFSILGAVTENAKVTFDQSEVTLDEALGLARGIVDTQADPTGVFVVRYEPAGLASQLPGIPRELIARSAGQPVPVVYQLDFSRPSGLLLAKRFPIRHRDTIFVANSEYNSAEKILRLVALALQPIATGAVVGNLAVN
ncbi:MAG: polysaccharide biosynthesis/export family protein [Pseudomonadota bacterium]